MQFALVAWLRSPKPLVSWYCFSVKGIRATSWLATSAESVGAGNPGVFGRVLVGDTLLELLLVRQLTH